VGAVWQRFDARDATSRIAWFAVILLILAPSTLVPKVGLHPYPLLAAIGIVCGAVPQDSWSQFRARQKDYRPLGLCAEPPVGIEPTTSHYEEA
jgi:hypothetical protein